MKINKAMMVWSCGVEDEAGTRRLGTSLSRVAGAGARVALHGELNINKTTLIHNYLTTTNHNKTIHNPTYTLIKPYTLPNHNITH